MAPPLVSVIIPAHNAAAHLGAAVSSALNQTYVAIEVVIVVDGGRDSTIDIATEFAEKDPRVRVLEQEQGGVALARNLAIRNSSGEFVAPLDADDYWFPQKIEAQVERMREGGREMGLVYAWWTGSSEDGVLRPPRSRPPIVEGRVLDALILSNLIGNASVPLFRRAALDDVGVYDASLRSRGGQGCEDWDLSLRVAERYTVGLVPDYLVAYRDVQQSMSKDVAQMERSYHLVMEGVEARTPTVGQDVLRWSEANFLLYLAGIAGTSSPRASVRYMARAVAIDPYALLARSLWKRAFKSARALWGGDAGPRGGPSSAPSGGDVPAVSATWWKPYRMIWRKRRREALARARARAATLT